MTVFVMTSLPAADCSTFSPLQWGMPRRQRCVVESVVRQVSRSLNQEKKNFIQPKALKTSRKTYSFTHIQIHIIRVNISKFWCFFGSGTGIAYRYTRPVVVLRVGLGATSSKKPKAQSFQMGSGWNLTRLFLE